MIDFKETLCLKIIKMNGFLRAGLKDFIILYLIDLNIN